MKRHLQSCVRRDSINIGQLLISQSKAATLLDASAKLSLKKFRKLLVAWTVMHDLPYIFIEWLGFRAIF